jgi:hypothetical protein
MEDISSKLSKIDQWQKAILELAFHKEKTLWRMTHPKVFYIKLLYYNNINVTKLL